MTKFKNITILKQITNGFSLLLGEVRGVARIENTTKANLLKLSFLNLSPLKNGRYEVFLWAKKSLSFPLDDLESQQFIFSGELYSVMLLFIDENSLTPVAYGSFCEANEKECLKNAQEYFKIKDEKSSEDRLFSQAEEGEIYDDEAVATVNYYDFIKENEDEKLSVGNDDTIDDNQSQSQKEKDGEFDKTQTYDNAKTRQKEGYFSQIKPELEKIFDENPKEENLSQMVTESKWVKVTHSGKSFVVGIIEEKSCPKFVCYGIPGVYGKKPKEIKGYATFIPSSPFYLKGEGYWVMYQNAQTGEGIE